MTTDPNRPADCVHLSRRRVCVGLGGVATALLARAAAGAPVHDTRRHAQRVVADAPTIIDMLGVLNLSTSPRFASSRLEDSDRDRFRQSKIKVFHHAYGIAGPDAYQATLQFFATWSAFIARNEDLFGLCTSARDMDRLSRESKIAVILGVQNSEHFRSVTDVSTFYALGQRCSMLTYNAQTRIGSGATDRVDGGVSDYGAAVIEKMNEVGMLIDLSHCGDRTTLDAIELSKSPVAITHANCRALNNHPRLKTDAAIRALAAKDGVMGISGVRMFVTDHEPATIEDIVNHIEHVAQLVGIEHVGVGSDADLVGYDALPAEELQTLKSSYKSSYAFRDKIDIEAFTGPMKMVNLTEALIRRGYSDAQIYAVLGGNFRRLLEAAWKE